MLRLKGTHPPLEVPPVNSCQELKEDQVLRPDAWRHTRVYGYNHIMTRVVTTFPRRQEFESATKALRKLLLPYEVLTPEPGYARVGVPSVVLDNETRSTLLAREPRFLCAGWVEYQPAALTVPSDPPPDFPEDVFGVAAIMVLATCVADPTKIRLVAHLSGDLTAALPYLNALLPTASFTPGGPSLTYMDGYRMVCLYPRRITIAKADDLVDAWRVLEAVRRQVNEAWSERTDIEPCFTTRKRPPALEIYRRLPRTNCGLCGEPSCLAFAVRVWQGERSPAGCIPVFGGDFGHLREALVEICRGLGVPE